MSHTATYTCTDYRTEMILLGLRRRLAAPDLVETEREAIRREIRKMETEMGLTTDADS
jgi:hypothetical protein